MQGHGEKTLLIVDIQGRGTRKRQGQAEGACCAESFAATMHRKRGRGLPERGQQRGRLPDVPLQGGAAREVPCMCCCSLFLFCYWQHKCFADHARVPLALQLPHALLFPPCTHQLALADETPQHVM